MSGSEGVNCPAADRLDSITDWGNRTVDFQYDGNSRLSAVELPNNTRRVYLYDFAGRLASVRQEQTSTGSLLVEHTYQYDALDRIEKETVEPEPAFFTVPVALMTYDADDRLDTFNGLQCVSDLDGNLVTGPLNGNLTGFTFDARNRLTAVGNASFTYDSAGRRTSKTENGTTTSYVHDPQASLSRMLTATTSNSTTFYVYAPGGMLLYEDGPAGLRVPHHDYRGSTVALSNATGAVIGRVVYGTYGEVASRTGDTDTRFLYHGAYGVETDANGLCLMRARYYSPETRRFLNADPIQFGGGLNWGTFLCSDPGMMIDPLGLDAVLKIYGVYLGNAVNASEFAGGNERGRMPSAYGPHQVNPNNPEAALPARLPLHQREVAVFNPRTGQTTAAIVTDVGPHNIRDRYWEQGTRPLAEAQYRDKRPAQNGAVPGNNAGIDLTPKAMDELGFEGPENTRQGRVIWSFSAEAFSGYTSFFKP